MAAFVNFAAFLVEFDRVRGGSFRLFLVRNRCGIDIGVPRFVIDPAMLSPQFLDLNQACFRQPRLRVIRQRKPEQLPTKTGERYAELFIGVRAPAFDWASPKRGVAQRVRKPTVAAKRRLEYALTRRAEVIATDKGSG